jgi:hypothetical protein
MSGSDVRSRSGTIYWFVDELPGNNGRLLNCDPFDPGALVASTPNVGRTVALEMRVKWDFIDDQNSSFSFTAFDCWLIDTTPATNPLGNSC